MDGVLLSIALLLVGFGLALELGVARFLDDREYIAAASAAKIGIALVAAGTLILLILLFSSSVVVAEGLSIETQLDEYKPYLEEWYNVSLPPLAYPKTTVRVESVFKGPGVPVGVEVRYDKDLTLVRAGREGNRFVAVFRVNTAVDYRYWDPTLEINYTDIRIVVTWNYAVQVDENETVIGEYRESGTLRVLRNRIDYLQVTAWVPGGDGCYWDGEAITVSVYNPALGYPPPPSDEWGSVLPPLPGQLLVDGFLGVYAVDEYNRAYMGRTFFLDGRDISLGANESVTFNASTVLLPRGASPILTLTYDLQAGLEGIPLYTLNSTVALPLARLVVAWSPEWPVTVDSYNGTLILEGPGDVCIEPGPVTVRCPGCEAWYSYVSGYAEAVLAPRGGTPTGGAGQGPLPLSLGLLFSAALLLMVLGVWLVLGRPGLDW